jgi:MATE family multidrug resistance protein
MNHSIHTSDTWPEVRRTLKLAAPVMIGLVAGFAMNFIDTVMAGRLPEQEVALAALATGGALWSAMLMLVIGLLMAVQPAVAQLDGAGEFTEAGAVTRQGFWIALTLGLPFFAVIWFGGSMLEFMRVDPVIIPVAVAYLQTLAFGAPLMCMVLLLRFYSEGSGHTRPTMYIGILGVLLNIPLNWMLMFGHLGFPAMGAAGCGLATSIVIGLQALALYIYVRRHSHYREFRLFERWDWPDLSRIRTLLRVGWPIAGTLFVEGSLFVAASLLIGRLGAVQAAAHLVAINFSALMFMIPLGLGSAVTTRVGNALGRGDPAGARQAGIIGLRIVLLTQTISMTLMLAFPGVIVSIYSGDAHVAALAASLLMYAAIFQFPDGVQICAAGILRGYKDTFVPMLINVVSYWVIGLSLGYWLTFAGGKGPAGMWIGMIAGLTTGAVLLSVRFVVRSRQALTPGGPALPAAPVA